MTTELHHAAAAGDLDRIRALAADLEAVDDWYALAPLGWATVVKNQPAAADLLLELGANLDPFSAVVRNDPSGLHSLDRRLGFAGFHRQPIHLAAGLGRVAIMQSILDRGADPHALTGWGVSALGIAIRDRRQEVVDTLKRNGVKPDLSAALFAHDLQLAAQLPIGPEHRLLLLACASAGFTEAVGHLLTRGADPHTPTPHIGPQGIETVTALDLARRNGHQQIAKLLTSE